MYKGLYIEYPLFLSIVMKLESSQQFLFKYSDVKFHEIPSRGSQVVPCGQKDVTDRHDESSRCVLQLCERA